MSSEILEKPLGTFSSNGTVHSDMARPRPKKWSNAEFESMIEAGYFQDSRVELIDGEILEMSPMMEPHALSLMLMQDQCYRIFSISEFGIRTQMPFLLGEGYRPEPDITVVRRSNLNPHSPPSAAELIIEVSDSTLRYDRSEKASLFAKAEVQEYWILNVLDRVLEVRRAPRVDTTAPFGFSYSSLQTYAIAESVAPLSAPNRVVNVSDLFA